MMEIDLLRLLEVIVAAAVAVGYVRARLDRFEDRFARFDSAIETINERLRYLEVSQAWRNGYDSRRSDLCGFGSSGVTNPSSDVGGIAGNSAADQ